MNTSAPKDPVACWNWAMVNGTVHVEVPWQLEAGELEEFEDLLEIIKRTMRRIGGKGRLPDTQRPEREGI